MQSFFGVAPITLAEDDVGEVIETNIVDDDKVESGEEIVEKEEETKPDSSEGEESSTTESELVEGDDEGEEESTEGKESNDFEVTEGTAGGIQPFNVAPANFDEEIDLQDSDIEKVTFKVNGQDTKFGYNVH